MALFACEGRMVTEGCDRIGERGSGARADYNRNGTHLGCHRHVTHTGELAKRRISGEVPRRVRLLRHSEESAHKHTDGLGRETQRSRGKARADHSRAWRPDGEVIRRSRGT